MWLHVLVAVAAVSRARAERRTRRRGLCPRHASDDGAAGACFRVSCRVPGWRTFSPSETEAPRSGPQPRVSDGARQVTLRQDSQSGLKRNGLRFRPHVDSVPGSWDTRGPRTTAQPPVPMATAPGRRGGSRGACPTSATSYHRSWLFPKAEDETGSSSLCPGISSHRITSSRVPAPRGAQWGTTRCRHRVTEVVVVLVGHSLARSVRAGDRWAGAGVHGSRRRHPRHSRRVLSCSEARASGDPVPSAVGPALAAPWSPRDGACRPRGRQRWGHV